MAFVPGVEQVQREAAVVLGLTGVALVAWAWQRRAILGPTTDELVAGFPPAWGPAGRLLLTTWGRALRASSAAENWHSILRPHLAAHRTLSPGLLALLAVRHNHRVFTRGLHAGFSPLQLSGLPDAPSPELAEGLAGRPGLPAGRTSHRSGTAGSTPSRVAGGRLAPRLLLSLEPCLKR